MLVAAMHTPSFCGSGVEMPTLVSDDASDCRMRDFKMQIDRVVTIRGGHAKTGEGRINRAGKQNTGY